MLNGCKDVDTLLFPVKPAARLGQGMHPGWAIMHPGWAFVLALAGCGFAPARAELSTQERLSVAAAAPHAPEFGAAEAAVQGARQELARWGLSSNEPYPRLVIELLRVEELAAGISESAGRATPAARGTEVALTGRAWIERTEGAPSTRETGDLTRAAQVAVAERAAADWVRQSGALRAAGEDLGRDLARAALGLPVADSTP